MVGTRQRYYVEDDEPRACSVFPSSGNSYGSFDRLVGCGFLLSDGELGSKPRHGRWRRAENLPEPCGRIERDSRHDSGAQLVFTIKDSTGGADGFHLNAIFNYGDRHYEMVCDGKLVGSNLQLDVRKRPDAPPVRLVAHKVPAGTGALPAKIAPPALHDVPANGLAKTPPMGWNSWNHFAGKVDDSGVRAMAAAMASNGMKAAGYQYINIDDTWEADRDASGHIRTNRKFPDMKGLAAYVHSKGLKIGIYSSPGPTTCGGYTGSYGHEKEDAETYAGWGLIT